MGYYSSVDIDFGEVLVDAEKAKDLEKYFGNSDVYGFSGVKIVVENNCMVDIELEEYYNKFYDDALFAKELSKVITNGEVKLRFTGEGGEKWGHNVRSGEVIEIDIVNVEMEHDDNFFKKFELLDKFEKIINSPGGVELLDNMFSNK